MVTVEPRISETGTGQPGRGAASGQQLGRYRLLHKIARGGMAEVYAARSFGAYGFEKTVAIKRILRKYSNDKQFLRMMVDEAKITVLLNHPNVAQVLELCEHDDDYFIVMEYVPGQSLSALWKRLREQGQKLGTLEACFIVTEILQGLHAAHAQRDSAGRLANIVHRDVSPQNVLLSFDGHVKLIDFGIARAKDRLEATEVGTIKGKLRYLAPEMIDPARFMPSADFDHRVDIFAAGIILWELIANRTLYEGDDELAVYDKITDTDAPDLLSLGASDAALAQIVKRALAREPTDRYRSAEAFADELRAYLYRNDPGFTHKRIAAVVERCFPAEREIAAALERGVPPAEVHAAAERNAKAAADAASRPRGTSDARPADAQQTARVEKAASLPPPPVLAPRPIDSNEETRTGAAHGVQAFPPEPRAPAPRFASAERRTGDDELPFSGDVITVVTLVASRRNAQAAPDQAAAPSAAPPPEQAGAQPNGIAAFAEDKPTVIEGGYGAGQHTGAPTDHGLSAAATELGPPQQTELAAPASPPTAPVEQTVVEAAPAATAAAVVTESLRGRRDGRRVAPPVGQAAAAPPASTRPAPGRQTTAKVLAVLALLCAAGAGVALVRSSAFRLPAAPSRAPVIVAVSSGTPGATVSVAGRSWPLPAEIPMLAGDVVELRIEKAGYLPEVRRIALARDATTVEGVEATLQAAPVSLVIVGLPPLASATVDGVPFAPGTTLVPGRPATLRVQSPGAPVLERVLNPAIGEALVVRLSAELPTDTACPGGACEPTAPALIPGSSVEAARATDAPAAAQAPARPSSDAPRKSPPPDLRPGRVSLRTKPAWAEVTVDGKPQPDVTPLTLELRAGRHKLVLNHPPKGWRKELVVNVKPGESIERTIQLDK